LKRCVKWIEGLFMDDIAALKIKVDTKEVKSASGDLGKLGKESKKAESASKGLSDSFNVMRGTLAAVGITLSISQLVRLSDSYTKLTAQLKLATESQEEFNQAYQNVQNISDRAQSSIEETSVLYARLANALKPLNASQKQVSDITEAVALGLKISGANAQESAGAMLQLSQAFGAGALTGDEFRAVNETAPRIMQALADSLGVARGELKGMAADGLLTSDVIGNALIGSIDKFRKEAEQVQNISGGLQSVTNQFTLMFGEIDKATGASKLLAQGLKGVADYFKELRTNQRSFAQESLKFGIGSLPTGLFLDYIQTDEPASTRTATGKITPAGSNGMLKKPDPSISSLFGEFSKDYKLKDAAAAQKEYSESLKLVNQAEEKGVITSGLAARYRAQLLSDLKSATKSHEKEVKSIEMVDTSYKQLLETARDLGKEELTQSERLQQLLDSYTDLDSSIRSYVQGQIDAVKADERRRESIALMVENQIYQAKEEKRIQEERRQSIAEIVEVEKQKLIKQKESFKELQNAVEGFSRNATNAFVDFAFGAETSFKSMVDTMLRELARLTIQKSIMDPLVNSLSESFSGGGGFFSFLTGRASGGNVNAGQPVVVGEAGREVFVPSAAGTVIPNGKTGGQVNNVSIVINEGSRQENGQDSSKMAKAIEQAVMGVLLKQKRQGGLLGA
jgi:tape measure domain-containing protein